MAARQGDAEEADRLYEESIATFRELGDDFGVAHVTAKLAQSARRRGDRASARARYADAIAIHERTGDRQAEARMSASLGDLAAEEGDFVEAQRLYQASVAIRGALGDQVGLAAALERLAGVAEDRPLRAASLLGGAQAIRDRIGAPLSPANITRVERFLADLADSAGNDAVRAAFSEGRASSWQSMLERAARSD